MRFEFATATRIIFGAGALRDAGPVAEELGRRALLVTGRNRGRANPLREVLQTHGLDAVDFAVAGEPTVELVEQGLALARSERCDCVIAFGGGSTLDAAKAIAALLTNDGAVLDYLEVIGHGKALEKASAPLLAIPTTAGTGSEVTRNAVLGSPRHAVKVSLRSAFMLPRVALVDPKLTYDLPPSITASTGLDALTQLIEPYVSPRATPMTDALCVQGIGRAARSLGRAWKNGKDTRAREDMALASLFGGLALANAGLGAVHGFAGPIGGSFPAPHGAICATLLPHVMAANLRVLRQREPDNPAIGRFGQIARLLTGTSEASPEAGIDWVRGLVSELQVPSLATYGVGPRHIPELIEKAAQASSMKANPVKLKPEELAAILETALR